MQALFIKVLYRRVFLQVETLYWLHHSTVSIREIIVVILTAFL